MHFVTAPTEKAQAAEATLRATLEGKQPGFDDDIIVAIGGDGTMLRAIRHNLDSNLPFLGISAGRLGFLQVVEPEQIEHLADALVAHNYHIVETPLLTAISNEQTLGYAFNDISLERSGPRAAKFHLKVGQSSGSFIGDGVIFATPLGSTAYNLAAGGPIIDVKTSNVFVVTPNNPHISVLYSSLQRPHVLGASRHVLISIDVEEAKAHPVKLIIDGKEINNNITGDLEICYSDKSVKLLELMPNDLHDRIESKRLGHY